METILHGKVFLLCDELGDVHGGTDGLYAHDTRHLSNLVLRIDGAGLLSLGEPHGSHHRRRFVQRNVPGRTLPADAVVVTREYVVDESLHVRVRVENIDHVARDVPVTLQLGADFDDVFLVKQTEFDRLGVETGEVGLDGERPHRERSFEPAEEPGTIVAIADAGSGRFTSLRATVAPATVHGGTVTWVPHIEPRGSWEVELGVDWGDRPEPLPLDDARLRLDRTRDLWIGGVPALEGVSPALARTWDTSIHDLAALQMDITGEGGEPCRVPAAGLPWFMTLFGRDSIITAIQTMSLGTGMAENAVRVLAARQSHYDNPHADAEPGKILHELREGGIADRGYDTYYGSVDSTPLFLVLVEEVHRWNGDDAFVREQWPHVLRAVEWLEHYADLDGDGYVQYRRRSDHGIENQSWKDSWDSQRFRDGSHATGVIAPAEVQGYAYDARLRVARLAEEVMGDAPLAARLRADAEALQEQFLRDFWVVDDSLPADDPRADGWFAMALDGDRRPVDSLTSNIGHLLWSGIVDEARAATIARQLVSPALNNGFGVRTMSTLDGAYSPLAYHDGTVWPHDTSLCIAGLVRNGFHEEASLLGYQLLEAAELFDGRLPEVFAGLGRDDTDGRPVSYPTTCSPQAWAAAAPIFVVAELLGVRPGPASEPAAVPPWLQGARLVPRS
jgi:glycogen debranching enzyme